MFVTNLAKHALGIDGLVILNPGEQNRYIEDTDDLVDRAKRLASIGLVSISFEEGLVKDGNPSVTETKLEGPKMEEPQKEEPSKEEVTEEVAEEEATAKPKRGGKVAK